MALLALQAARARATLTLLGAKPILEVVIRSAWEMGWAPISCVFDVEFTPGVPGDAANRVSNVLLGRVRDFRTFLGPGSVMYFMDQLHIAC